MNVADLRPKPPHQVDFSLYSASRTPEYSGCYCLTNASGDILYIGQAASIRQRLSQHFDSDKRSANTIHGRISVAWWCEFNEAGISALERGWIESARLCDGNLPPLNRIGAPI
ncbi:MAG: hypothetical protein EAZ30_17275 [Betaproteobacteria bacterium]|nr:MAG: hypothetical protein EAZ30_17275 [Betaproteobacteria bacterium]